MTSIGSFLARAGAAAGIAIGTALWAASAQADCFEGIGCTDSDYFDVDDLVQLSCANLGMFATGSTMRMDTASKLGLRSAGLTIPTAGSRASRR